MKPVCTIKIYAYRVLVDRLQPCWNRDNFYETPMLRRHDKRLIKVTWYVDKTLYGRLEYIDHNHIYIMCVSSIIYTIYIIYIYNIYNIYNITYIYVNGIEWLSVVQWASCTFIEGIRRPQIQNWFEGKSAVHQGLCRHPSRFRMFIPYHNCHKS